MKSYAVRAFRRREVRDWPRLVHRHRWLFEVAHQPAERAASKAKGDRTQIRASKNPAKKNQGETSSGVLNRRNVYKVAVAYAIVDWLLVQIAIQVFPFLEIPNWECG
jgi:hypothetical protein